MAHVPLQPWTIRLCVTVATDHEDIPNMAVQEGRRGILKHMGSLHMAKTSKHTVGSYAK